MRDAGLGRVIGVDVGADPDVHHRQRRFRCAAVVETPAVVRRAQAANQHPEILWRSGMVNSAANTLARRELSDLLLQPPLEQIDMLNWHAFDRAIEAGYRIHAGPRA